MPARFDLCTCGKHGRIVFENETSGREICFKQDGFHFARVAAESDIVTDTELEELMASIVSSSLPITPEEADLPLLYRTEALNKVVEELFAEENPCVEDGIDPEALCAFLHDPVEPGEIPPSFLAFVKKVVAEVQPQ